MNKRGTKIWEYEKKWRAPLKKAKILKREILQNRIFRVSLLSRSSMPCNVQLEK